MGCAAGREGSVANSTAHEGKGSTAHTVSQAADVNARVDAPPASVGGDSTLATKPAVTMHRPNSPTSSSNRALAAAAPAVSQLNTSLSAPLNTTASSAPRPENVAPAPRMFMPTFSDSVVTPISRRTTQSVSSSNVLSASKNVATPHDGAPPPAAVTDTPKKLIRRCGRYSIPVTLTSLPPPPSAAQDCVNPLETKQPEAVNSATAALTTKRSLSQRFCSPTMSPPQAFPLDPPTHFSTSSESVSRDVSQEEAASTRVSSLDIGDESRGRARVLRSDRQRSGGDVPSQSRSHSPSEPDFVADSAEISVAPDLSSWSGATSSVSR